MALPYPNPSLSDMASQKGHAKDTTTVTATAKATVVERFDTQEDPDWKRPLMTRLRRIMLTIIICSGLMFSCLDTSIVSTALVTISKDLGNDYLNAPWVVLAYLLTYMSFAVGFSKLSDIYGRKALLVTAWVFFSGFSVWCAMATSMPQLIAARALQGIGGSGLYSLAQTCLMEQGPSRPELVGALVGITLSISYVLGPLLGGGLSVWTWRGIFWINVPCGTLAMAGVILLWPEGEDRYRGRAALSKIDFIGNFLLIVSSILLIFGVQEAGSLVWAWSDPTIVWALVISGLGWILLCLWEAHLHWHCDQDIQPIFPLRMAKSRGYMSSLLVTFLTGFTYIALVIEVPERLQIIHGDSPLMAGVHLLPMLGATAFGSFAGGAISRSKNLTSPTLIAGACFQLLGLGLLYRFAHSAADMRPIFAFTTLYGLGVGLCFAAGTIFASVEVQVHDLAVAQGAIAQARVFGGALGLAACTILFNGLVQWKLRTDQHFHLAAPELDMIHRSPIAALGLAPAKAAKVKLIYLQAFENQIYLMLIVSALAVMLSLASYRANAPPVTESMNLHKKDKACRASESELDSVRSVRSF